MSPRTTHITWLEIKQHPNSNLVASNSKASSAAQRWAANQSRQSIYQNEVEPLERRMQIGGDDEWGGKHVNIYGHSSFDRYFVSTKSVDCRGERAEIRADASALVRANDLTPPLE